MVAGHPVIVPLPAAPIEATHTADAVFDFVLAFEELDAQALGGVPGNVAMHDL